MSAPSRASERSGAEQLPAIDAGKTYPLSYGQETMLFWDRLVPRSAVYNVPFSMRIRGKIDIAALRKTIKLIFTRHEVLRSRFLFTDDEPGQTVDRAPSDEDCLSITDISELRNDLTAVTDRVNLEARRPFDLATDPMLRAVLFKVANDEYVLLLNMHHIAADGWSIGILLREVSDGYLAFSQSQEPDLPRLSTQYAGFAKWQRELVQGPERDRALAFWRQQLADMPEFTEVLPLDHPRSPQQKFEGATVVTTMPESLSAALAEIGQKRRATTFMVMLAAFQVLQRCYSGQDVIAVGTPVANRGRADFLDLIGCFINMVVIRSDLSGNPSFLDFLGRVREISLAAFFHPELPFSELVRHLHPKRSMSHTPLFQVQLVFQNFPMPTIHWPNLEVTRFDVDTATSKFDVSVLIEPRNGLEIGFEYNTQLFEATTMQRLLQQYTSLLECIVRAPETRIDEFRIATEQGAHR